VRLHLAGTGLTHAPAPGRSSTRSTRYRAMLGIGLTVVLFVILGNPQRAGHIRRRSGGRLAVQR